MSKTGMYTEPEVRMAAKAGMRVFEIIGRGQYSMEITQELTGLFKKFDCQAVLKQAPGIDIRQKMTALGLFD